MNILTDYDPGDDLQRLANTDLEAAQLKRAVEAHDYLCKKAKYIEFLAATGNNEERKAKSEVHENYKIAKDKYLDAVQESEALQNERQTLRLKIDVWRSLNANRRQAI